MAAASRAAATASAADIPVPTEAVEISIDVPKKDNPKETEKKIINKILPVPYYHQATGTTCYAAITQSLIDFRTGVKVKQADLAKEIRGKDTTEFKKGEDLSLANPYEYLVEKGYVSAEKGTILTGDLTWPAVKAEIDKGNPMIGKVGIHYILIIGYSGNNSRDRMRSITFIDPLVGVRTYTVERIDDSGQHIEGGFPTGGAAAAIKGTATVAYSDLDREKWVGILKTKAPPSPRTVVTKRRRTRRRRGSRRA
jgi:hypothetical protein